MGREGHLVDAGQYVSKGAAGRQAAVIRRTVSSPTCGQGIGGSIGDRHRQVLPPVSGLDDTQVVPATGVGLARRRVVIVAQFYNEIPRQLSPAGGDRIGDDIQADAYATEFAIIPKIMLIGAIQKADAEKSRLLRNTGASRPMLASTHVSPGTFLIPPHPCAPLEKSTVDVTGPAIAILLAKKSADAHIILCKSMICLY